MVDSLSRDIDLLTAPPKEKEEPATDDKKPSEDALPLLVDPKQPGKKPMSTDNLKKYSDQYFKGDTKAAVEYLKKQGFIEQPTPAKDVPSNKYTQDKPAKPTSKEEYDKLPPNSYYLQDGVVKRKKG